MSIVDERGHLFGRVNVVDAVVVLLVIAVAIAGGTFLTSTPGTAAGEGTVETSITVQAAVPPYVLDAIEPGVVADDGVRALTSVETLGTVERAEMDAAGSTTYHRIALTVDVVAERTDGGLAFRDDQLAVGREISLDLGRTVVDGVIVDYAA